MTLNRHQPRTRQCRRSVVILLLLLVLAISLITLLPPGTPTALAGRLFQSPVETPAPPTAAPEQPTPTVQPTEAPPTPVPTQPLPSDTPVSEQEAPPAQTATVPESGSVEQPTVAPVQESPAGAELSADSPREPDDRPVNWVKLIDTTVLVFSWFWLACGIVVVVAVVVLLLTIYFRSRRRTR